MRNEHIRVQTVQLSPSAKWSAVVITFRYPDRSAAQRVRRQLATQFMTGAGQSGTEILDPASDPQAPSYPRSAADCGIGDDCRDFAGVGGLAFPPDEAGDGMRWGKLVDDGGIEPPTSALRTQRSPS
jgi:hypothetical protein